MDGVTFLQKIMSQRPIPVVMCSSVAERGSDNALRAMEYGAVDSILPLEGIAGSVLGICSRANEDTRGPGLRAGI